MENSVPVVATSGLVLVQKIVEDRHHEFGAEFVATAFEQL